MSRPVVKSYNFRKTCSVDNGICLADNVKKSFVALTFSAYLRKHEYICCINNKFYGLLVYPEHKSTLYIH